MIVQLHRLIVHSTSLGEIKLLPITITEVESANVDHKYTCTNVTLLRKLKLT